MTTDWKARLSGILSEAEKIIEENKVSERLLTAFNTVQAETDKIIKEYGISEKVTAATKNITDQFENFTGNKLSQDLQERLDLQTDEIGKVEQKLEEAIKRIEALEKKA